MWYGVVGASDLIGHSCASLPHTVRLEVDGLEVPLPDDIEGLMLLNISSYMGGVNLWTCGREATDPMGAYDMGAGGGSSSAPWQYGGAPLPGDLTQSMSDGIIEAVAVYGTWHLGQLQVRLFEVHPISQLPHYINRVDAFIYQFVF
jgi:diacylglycerol kinase (ATP)